MIMYMVENKLRRANKAKRHKVNKDDMTYIKLQCSRNRCPYVQRAYPCVVLYHSFIICQQKEWFIMHNMIQT